MSRLRGLFGLAASIIVAFIGLAPATAATSTQGLSSVELAHGLIVQYKPGVEPIADDGNPTAANAAHTYLSAGHALGNNIFTLNFASEILYTDAIRYAAQISQDPRVVFANVDRIIGRTSIDAKTVQIKSAIVAASAPQSLKAIDYWSSTFPAIPRVKLTWKAPSYLRGAKLNRYLIEYSANSGKSWTRLSGTKSASYVFSTRILAGKKYSYRVRALTQSGTATKIGNASTATSLIVRTAPQAPVLVSGSSATATSNTVSWAAQSLAQKGGLAVTYRVAAKAAGQVDVSCQSTTTSCNLVGLAASTTYSVSLTATNSRGQTAATNGAGSVSEPLFGSQWYLNATQGVNAPKAWTFTKGSPKVVVAVIDSGITAHSDLDGQLVTGYDFVSNGSEKCDGSNSGDGDGWDANPSDPGDYYTDDTGFHASSWHGTHVAGIIAAAQNGEGTSGIAPNVKIQPIRAMGPNGGCSSDLIAALNWAAGLPVPNAPSNTTPAKVINLSMGTSNASNCDYYAAGGSLGSTGGALAALKKLGITTITAAGNSNTDATDSYPGNCYPTINVGATGISQDRSWYSNYTIQTNSEGAGVGVDISAPGGDDRDFATAPAGTKGKILSTYNDGSKAPGSPTYGLEEGTSMAAPVVSGVVALLYSINPDISFDQVYEVLKNSVTPFKAGGDCASATITKCGVGIVNAGNAVEYLVTHG